MDDELAAVFDAWDKESGDGRDAERAYQLSDDYVEAHPDEFKNYENLPLKYCVQELEDLRNSGNEDWRKVQVWLWHQFEPQNIGGVYEPKLRVTNGN